MRGRLFGAVAVVVLVAVALSGGRSPAAGQAKPTAKKLGFPHVTPPPESSATAFKWMCDELTKRSGGALNVVFHGGTLLTKELEIMDAVKSGNVALGNPAGAACTVFPEMCVFLTPYLVRDYNHAYAMFNGEIGRNLDEIFQKKYKAKVLLFYDYGFRQLWHNRRPMPASADLTGPKLRGQQGRAGGPSRRSLVPQGRRGEDLAAVPAVVRRDVGQARQYALRRVQWPRPSDLSVSGTWATRWRPTS